MTHILLHPIQAFKEWNYKRYDLKVGRLNKQEYWMCTTNAEEKALIRTLTTYFDNQGIDNSRSKAIALLADRLPDGLQAYVFQETLIGQVYKALAKVLIRACVYTASVFATIAFYRLGITALSHVWSIPLFSSQFTLGMAISISLFLLLFVEIESSSVVERVMSFMRVILDYFHHRFRRRVHTLQFSVQDGRIQLVDSDGQLIGMPVHSSLKRTLPGDRNIDWTEIIFPDRENKIKD
jgi:hypothetical protein